jgi:hypothetical protein
MVAILKNTVAPSLPNATKEHDEQYFNQFNNILRLYFNTIDGFNTALVSENGGKELSFPHVSAYDTTDQYAAGDNTATKVKWNTLDSSSGFTLNANNSATALASGFFNIQYSLQFINTSNANETAYVWLKVNNNDVPGSSSKFTIPARKSVGNNGFVVAFSVVPFRMEADDVVELWWATTLAYNTTGPVDGVFIEHQDAQTSPFAYPSTPSSLGVITFVSR